MARKYRNVDVVSTNLNVKSGNLTFKELLEFLNGKECSVKGKLIEITVDTKKMDDCYIGLVSTIQDKELAPKRNKQTKVMEKLSINPEEEGLAYGNIFLFDHKRNILIYEVNKNGCYLNDFIHIAYLHWNKQNGEKRKFDLSFPIVLRQNEYERLLKLDYYKKVVLEVHKPNELVKVFNENRKSIAENIIDKNVNVANKTNADILTVTHQTFPKKINQLGLSRSVVKKFMDAVLKIVEKGHRQNIAEAKVLGYDYDSESPRRLKTVSFFADTFKEKFSLEEVLLHSDLQENERKEEIEGVYNRILPELKTINGD